jgi:hypothetical protein
VKPERHLQLVQSEPAHHTLLRELIAEHDAAAAVVEKTRRLIRPLARAYADDQMAGGTKRQFTLPGLDQLRRELKP